MNSIKFYLNTFCIKININKINDNKCILSLNLLIANSIHIINTKKFKKYIYYN
jgi:hypothetical protein